MGITPAINYLVGKCAELNGVGQVLDHYPLDAKTATLAKAAFSDEGELNFLIIRRKLAEEANGENFSAGQHTLWLEYRRTYTGSASTQACDAVVDAILASLWDDETLGGTVYRREPARLTESEPNLLFNTWLTHYARIELVVEV